MDDIFIYFVRLPTKIREMVTPCADGYTVYIDERLDESQRMKAYRHALEHIKHGDLDGDTDVDKIEKKRHAG